MTYFSEFVILKAWESFPNLILALLITAITFVGKLFTAYWIKELTGRRYFIDRVKDMLPFAFYGCFVSHFPVGI